MVGGGSEFEAEGRREAELGYGVARRGARWQMGPGALLGLEGRRSGSGGEMTNDVMLRLRVDF